MTRSQFEECFIKKHPLPYEELSLPYIRNYVPDFHVEGKFIIELKGVLQKDDAQKISSTFSFLTTDNIYVIVGAKFKEIDKLREALAPYLSTTIFHYPDLHYAIAPQLTKVELANYHLMRGNPAPHGKFPLTGVEMISWANKMGIRSLPMSYTDHRSFEVYAKNFL